MALRAALQHYKTFTQALGDADIAGHHDRLEEIQRMMTAPVRSGMPIDPPEERERAEKMLTGMHLQRRNRILQLAGIVPEQATERQMRLAMGYVATTLAPDEAAVRLIRAMEQGS
jgi:hypothetical protein